LIAIFVAISFGQFWCFRGISLAGFPWKVLDSDMAYPSTQQNCPSFSAVS